MDRRISHFLGAASLVAASLGLVACGQEPPVSPAVEPPAQAELAPVTTRAPEPQVLQRLAELQLEGLEPQAFESEGSLAASQARGFQGPAPAAIAESAQPVDQSSPESLVTGAIDAIARQDVAALARLSRSSSERPSLTEDDAADARRRYLAPAMAPTWSRVAAALQAGRFEIQETAPTQVVVVVRVGGALGSYRISLRKNGDSWFMVG